MPTLIIIISKQEEGLCDCLIIIRIKRKKQHQSKDKQDW